MMIAALKDCWHPVAYSGGIGAEPVPIRLLNEPLVLFRSAGTAVCFRDLCVHRGTALSRGRVDVDGCLVCPYHGWSYDATGQCIRIPQQAPDLPIPRKAHATAYRCEERYGMVWVCLGEPRWEIPPFPEYDDPRYRVVPCGPFDWRANAARMIENFNDLGHFAYVHPGLLGDPLHPVVQPYEVQRVGNEIQYEVEVHAANPNGEFRITNLVADEEPLVRNVYRLIMPFTSHLAVLYPKGGRRVVFSACSPISEKECRVFSNLGRNFDFHVPDAEIVAWEERVIRQDQAMVESQRPEELPVDLSAEMHIRGDRSAVEYRRWLGELGIEQFDTAAVSVMV